MGRGVGSWGEAPRRPKGAEPTPLAGSAVRQQSCRRGFATRGCTERRGGRAVQEANPRIGSEAADIRPREAGSVAPTPWKPEGSSRRDCTFPQYGSKARGARCR